MLRLEQLGVALNAQSIFCCLWFGASGDRLLS